MNRHLIDAMNMQIDESSILRDSLSDSMKRSKDMLEMLKSACEERDKYKKALEGIIPMCGNPSAVDACRLIVNKCQEAIK